MIAEVVLHVVKQSAKYNRMRAKESTWVWWVAERRCNSLVSHFNRYKVCASVVPLDDVQLRKLPSTSSLQQRTSREAVERVIERSSDRVLELLEQLFKGTIRPRFSHSEDGQWITINKQQVFMSRTGEIRAGNPEIMSLLEEVRDTFRKCAATLEDLTTALHYYAN